MNKVSLNILTSGLFKNFIEKYTKRRLLSRSTYISKIIPDLYEMLHSKAIDSFKSQPFYLMIDESPDFTGRKIVNILIGKLNEAEYTKPVLINTLVIINANGPTIAQIVIHEISSLCAPENYSNFKLLLTDRAPYCKAAGDILKGVIPSLST